MGAEERSSPDETVSLGFTGADTIDALFQTDTLVPGKYIADRLSKTLEPEKRLMLAVLEDAVICFQDYYSARCGQSKKLFDEAQQWIFAPSDWVFGFENICSALGFDAEYIRTGLMRWRAKELSKFRSVEGERRTGN